MRSLFSKNYKFIILLAVLAIGIFLRSYHFADWLHFELDQSRDAKVIDLAIKENRYNYFLKCYKDVLESLPKMKQKEVLKVYSQMITMREVQGSGDAVLNHVLFPPANKEVN